MTDIFLVKLFELEYKEFSEKAFENKLNLENKKSINKETNECINCSKRNSCTYINSKYSFLMPSCAKVIE